MIPGGQRFLAHDLHSHGALTYSLHVLHGLQEGASLCIAPLVMLSPVCPQVISHPGACDHVAPVTTWPMAMQAPHTSSKKKPEIDSSEEQAKLLVWGL